VLFVKLTLFTFFCLLSYQLTNFRLLLSVGSIEKTFSNCLTSMSDFKELIPEFYASNGEFLRNVHRINFGMRQDRQPVSDVELPPWANSL